MTSENDSQMATSAEGQDTAQETTPDEKLDYKSLYLKEIENSKKQRTGKQTATSEVDKLQAKINQYEEDKLIKEGKQSELIDKLKAENKDLSGYKDKYSSYLETEKANILEQFPEEDREELATKDLSTLKYIHKSLNKEQPEGKHIPNIPSMVKNNKSQIKDWTKLDPDELRENWDDIVKDAKAKS